MRVVRHESGWDIALDMVFTDKKTAEIIAKRIQYAMPALVRGALDASMRGPKASPRAAKKAAGGPPSETVSATADQCIAALQMQPEL
jgi:hypothetical protein